MWWAAAAAALAGGVPEQAERHARAALAEQIGGHPARALAIVTLAWARYELGLPPDVDYPSPERNMLLAVPHELAGLRAAHSKGWSEAAEELATAARLWAPYHRRGELRCEWAAAEMLRLGGQVGDAVTSLTMLEKRCVDLGNVAVLHRVRRSLRACGERRHAPRSSGGRVTLTGREREVLGLVATGLTNTQIAARLGVSRRTVVSLVEAGSAKLGAHNRNQAAALAAELVDP
jgi:DNA-binding CsgD family transcriptional regulator